MTRIEIVLSDSTTAHVEGRTFTLSPRWARAGVTPAVARALLAEGYDPMILVRVTRNGTTVFRDARLSAWADLCVEEGDYLSARFRRYRPWSPLNTGELAGGSGPGRAEEL